MPEEKLVTVDEITKHASQDDCWIVVDNKVYDVTEYATAHPGGSQIIWQHAGRDATSTYSSVHAPSLIRKTLDPSKHLGTLDKRTVNDTWLKPPPGATPELKVAEKPPLETLINAHDFEAVARRTITPKAWAFYSSAATECISRDANRTHFDRIWFRPRLIRDVSRVSTACRILGCPSALPLFISPAAQAKMVHPDGELALARAAVRTGIIQAVSSNASYPVAEVLAATPETQPTFFQLYVNSDTAKARTLLDEILALRPRIRGIMITVDAAVQGKREADERVRADESISSPISGARASNDRRGGGMGRLMGSWISSALTWDTVAWIREVVGPDMPLLLKGVQHAADARLAMEAGLQGVVLSNHGGRNLDGSPSAVMTLLEMHRLTPEVFGKLEVLVDGGVRRGTDVLKCLCLGATACGVGRSFLYALNYGQDGVEHLVDIIQDELRTAMALVGVTNVEDAAPEYVNTGDLDALVAHDFGHPYARKTPKAKL